DRDVVTGRAAVAAVDHLAAARGHLGQPAAGEDVLARVRVARPRRAVAVHGVAVVVGAADREGPAVHADRGRHGLGVASRRLAAGERVAQGLGRARADVAHDGQGPGALEPADLGACERAEVAARPDAVAEYRQHALEHLHRLAR